MKNKKQQKGFTLPEVIIGISVLLIAIMTASNLIISIIRGNKVNMNDLTAYYLASEGVEAMRNIRDTQWFNNLKWTGDAKYDFWAGAGDAAIDFSEAAKSTYIVSRKTISVDALSAPVTGGVVSTGFNTKDVKDAVPWLVSKLSQADIDSGVAQLVFGGVNSEQLMHVKHLPLLSSGVVDKSQFSRYVEVEMLNDKKMQVDSVVTWKESGRDREMRLSTILTDWKAGPS